MAYRSDHFTEGDWAAMMANLERCVALNGAERGRDIYIVGASPALAALSKEEIAFLEAQPLIGVNRTQYLLAIRYFLSAYAGEVLLAQMRLPEGAVALHMRPVIAPPIVSGSLALQRLEFDHTGLPSRFLPPVPQLRTKQNVALGASNLALILGAGRIIYIGVELENQLHFYDLLPDLKQRIIEDMETTADFPYHDLDHKYTTYECWRREIDRTTEEVTALSALMDYAGVFAQYRATLASYGCEVLTATPGGTLERARIPYRPLEALMKEAAHRTSTA